MNAEQDRRTEACVRFGNLGKEGRKEGTKHSLLACYEELSGRTSK
jgi:hypothetical protein